MIIFEYKINYTIQLKVNIHSGKFQPVRYGTVLLFLEKYFLHLNKLFVHVHC